MIDGSVKLPDGPAYIGHELHWQPGQLRTVLAAVVAAGHRARESTTLPTPTPKQLALAALADADAILELAAKERS